jgi:hypothetical protein
MNERPSTTHSGKLQELENKRQALIIRMVEYVQQEIGDFTDTELEASYMTYKVGGALLAKVLEKFDQAQLIADLQSLK